MFVKVLLTLNKVFVILIARKLTMRNKMEHINTLDMYRQYLSAGYTEQQAVAAVRALDSSLNDLVTKDDLNSGLQKLENDLKLYVGRIIGSTIGGSFLFVLIFPFIMSIIFKKLGL